VTPQIYLLCRWTELDGATSVSTDVHYHMPGVAYRGLVNEADLEAEAATLHRAICVLSISQPHILQYVIPGEHESLEPGPPSTGFGMLIMIRRQNCPAF